MKECATCKRHYRPCREWREKSSRYCSRRCYLRARFVSSVEVAVRYALRRARVRFETQYPVGRWHADLYVPKLRTVIEVDGTYWHTLPGAAARDRRMDAWLRDNNYAVVRLPEIDVRQDVEAALRRHWPLWTTLIERRSAA
jgi:very-short-patch-repair endonuclease